MLRTVGNCGCAQGNRMYGLRGDAGTAAQVGTRTAIGLLATMAVLVAGVVLVTR